MRRRPEISGVGGTRAPWDIGMGMDLLAAMRIYVRVVERETMSGAARDLGMGQPAVSERIEKLERFLGVTLLLRTGRALKCTEAGRVFYERSQGLLAGAAEAAEAVWSANQEIGGTLRIAAAHCYGEKVVVPTIIAARTEHPGLLVDLVLNDDLVDPAVEGVDLSIRLGSAGDGRYLAYPLGEVDSVLVAAPEYLDRCGRIASGEDLAGHPFIRVKDTFPNGVLPMLDGATGSAVFAPIRTAVTTTHWRAMYDIILGAGGIGVVQQPACAAELASGRLVRLLPDHGLRALPVTALAPAQRPLPRKTRAMIGMLRQAIASRPAGAAAAGLREAARLPRLQTNMSATR